MPEYNVPANFGTFVLVFDIYATSSSASANTSTVYYNAYLKKTAGSTSVQPFNGNPSTIKVWLDSGEANPNRHNHTVTYDFRSPNNKIGATVGLGASGTVTFTHGTNGARSVTWRAMFEGAGGSPLGTGDSGYQTLTLSDFDRSANTPYYNNITRNSSTNIYVEYARTGSVNGPTTYVLECATNAAMTENYTTFGEGNQTVNANTAYYYRMYAYGDEGGNKYSGVYGPYWGQPVPPTNVTGTRSTSVAGRIDVAWTKPSNTQGGIQHYHVYRNGTFLAQVNGENSVSYTDSGLSRGTSHTYQVYALGASFWSEVSNTSALTMAPGVPSAPGTPTISSKVGRTLTLNSTRGSSDYGNAISEYRIQLSTDNGATWKGWDNTSKTFTANNTYNTLDGSGNFTYQLLTPALTYKWRVYAVNSIGTGDMATMSAGTFVGAGGKRFDGTSWNPTTTSKRFDGTNWVDFTIAKRFDGTNWVDLT